MLPNSDACQGGGAGTRPLLYPQFCKKSWTRTYHCGTGDYLWVPRMIIRKVRSSGLFLAGLWRRNTRLPSDCPSELHLPVSSALALSKVVLRWQCEKIK